MDDIIRQPGSGIVGACPICAAQAIQTEWVQVRGEAGQTAIAVCAVCGHGWRPGAGFQENIAAQIQETESKLGQSGPHSVRWPGRLSLVAAQVHHLIGQQGIALDIGCSRGLWFHALGDGWQRYGVEVSPRAAQLARQIARANVFCGPFEQYEPPIRQFDLITGFALIEHLAEPRNMVTWVREHLRPCGLFVVMTGDREAEVARQMGSRWPLYGSPDHVSYFSARSLRRLITDCGFQICREEWRPMVYQGGRGAVAWAKAKELLGFITTPGADHYYCYARKP